MYTCTKFYPHSLGLSCVFRQPGAESHCRFLHGYAFAVTLVFEAEDLDSNNWVKDFGSLKPVKEFLTRTFDHKLVIARGDPKRPLLESLGEYGIADIVYMDDVGCEAFAKYIGDFVVALLAGHNHAAGSDRVRLRACTVHEHEGNLACWEPSR